MERIIALQNKAFYYLCYFITYSFIGWVIEVMYVSITQQKVTNRGFLYGPFCTIYGFGVILLILLLQPLKKNLYLSFVAAVVLTSMLEYLTGFALEMAFGSRWWDYSNEFFNLNGRICLRTSITWGLASISVLNLVHPWVVKLSEKVPSACRIITAHAMLFYFVADFSLSIASFTGFRALFPIFSIFYPTIYF